MPPTPSSEVADKFILYPASGGRDNTVPVPGLAARGLEFVLHRVRCAPEDFPSVVACYDVLKSKDATTHLTTEHAKRAAKQLSVMWASPNVPGNQASAVVAWWATLQSAGYSVPTAPVPAPGRTVVMPRFAWGLLSEVMHRTTCSADLIFQAAEVQDAYRGAQAQGVETVELSLSAGALSYCREVIEAYIQSFFKQEEGGERGGVPAPQVPALYALQKAFI